MDFETRAIHAGQEPDSLMGRVEDAYRDLQAGPAVVVADGDSVAGVLTRTDVLEYLAHGT